MAKNELKVVDSFDLQTISGDLAQAVAEEMDGLGSLPFDRVKIPSGGGLAFEVPGEDDENPESATEIVRCGRNQFYCMHPEAKTECLPHRIITRSRESEIPTKTAPKWCPLNQKEG